MLTVEAPAKINLTIEIPGKRPDGYHEIRSVIQTINFVDIFCFSDGETIDFRCNLPEWSAEQSLVSRTVKLLKSATGYSSGVMIEFEKHIPMMAGLGGDSSDAAAVLRGLNEFWKLGLSREQLLNFAAQLGSDVTFFLYGGTCLITGRGEMVTPLPPMPSRWVVVVIPSVQRLPGKTQRMYASLKPIHYTDGQITAKLVSDLESGHAPDISHLFNTFENVAFTQGNELNTYRAHILKIGAPNVHLAGSGPALFTLLDDKARAEDLFLRLKNQGMEAYLTETRTGL